MTSSNSAAARALRALGRMRLGGDVPAHGVIITNDRSLAGLFRELRFAVIELWRRDIEEGLDWSALVELRVQVFVVGLQHEDRMKLFDSIRSALPHELQWSAYSRGASVGRLKLVGGDPVPVPLIGMIDSDSRNRGSGWGYGRV